MDKVCYTAALSIARGVLDTEDDGVGVVNVMAAHVHDAAFRGTGHALRVVLRRELSSGERFKQGGKYQKRDEDRQTDRQTDREVRVCSTKTLPALT